MLGDPIELKALGAVLGAGRSRARPLRVGSVKTNIAHTEGAAGIAGLVKAVLAMQHRQVPASLHCDPPSPHIPFTELALRVPTELERWPAPESEPALAGVSSFGWGGTDAHAVLEGAPPDPHVLAFAAPTMNELRARARALRAELTARSSHAWEAAIHGAIPAAELGWHRIAVAARSPATAAEALDAFLRGAPHPALHTGPALDRRPRVVFVFSPLGSQWVGMGRQLLASKPAFPPDRPFAELGLDSLMAIELRNRLGAGLDLRLEVKLLLEFPATPSDRRAPATARIRGARRGPRSAGGHHSAGLGDLRSLAIGSARARTRAPGGLHQGASYARERVAGPSSGEPDPARACRRYRARSAVRRRAAAHLGARDVRRARLRPRRPSRRVGPIESRLRARRAAPRRSGCCARGPHRARATNAGGAPFAILGVSSGGWVAHALTSHLERIGLGPIGLVLIDTYPPDLVPADLLSLFFETWLERAAHVGWIDNELTAFRWYLDLLASWSPSEIATPTLLLRATDPVPGIDARVASEQWRASWRQPHALVDIPGHHLHLLTEHVASTAAVIHDWPTDIAARASESRARRRRTDALC